MSIIQCVDKSSILRQHNIWTLAFLHWKNGAHCIKNLRHMLCLEHFCLQFFGKPKLENQKLNTNRCFENANSWSYVRVPVRIETSFCSIMHAYEMHFRIIHKWTTTNRHFAFWNIRVVVLRTRVCTYEDVACHLGKYAHANSLNQDFEQSNYCFAFETYFF